MACSLVLGNLQNSRWKDINQLIIKKYKIRTVFNTLKEHFSGPEPTSKILGQESRSRVYFTNNAALVGALKLFPGP